MLSKPKKTFSAPLVDHRQLKTCNKKIKRLQNKLQRKEEECELLLSELHNAQGVYVTEVNETRSLLNSQLNDLKNLNLALVEELHEAQNAYITEVNETESLVNSKLNDLYNLNSKLVEQLHQTQENLVESANLVDSNARKPFYGAKEVIKNDLPYKIGATMVSHSKSLKKFVVMPLALVREYSKFKKTNQNIKRLPDLNMYEDHVEAEKVKQHLSYKVGTAMVDGMQSPIKAIKVPYRLYKEVIKFKKSKKA